MQRFFRAWGFAAFLMLGFILVSFVWDLIFIGYEAVWGNLLNSHLTLLFYFLLLGAVFWVYLEIRHHGRLDSD